MKYKFLATSLLVFFMSNNVSAFFNPFSWFGGNETINGAASITNKKFTKHLTVNGAFDANEIETEDLTINGAAKISNSQIKGTLDISGSLNINSSSIDKQVNIHGKIDGSNVTFKNKIISYGIIELNNSIAHDIIIENVKKGRVILKGKTTINGVIRFKSNKGKVYISDETTITGGIEGGEVIKNSDKKITKIEPIISQK